MRGVINVLAIASLCCLLLLFGCGTNETNPSTPGNNAQDAQQNNNANPSQPVIIVPDDPTPVIPNEPPVVGPVTPGGGGGGGGSQGAEEPARTGNPDNDPLAQPELLCDDGLDNDDDGVIDCLDPNCAGKTCDDENPCTIGDTCNNFVCSGVARSCEVEIGDQCSVDVCEAVNTIDYRCVSSFNDSLTNFGGCVPEGNCASLNPDGTCAAVLDLCIVGRCTFDPEDTPPVEFICESANRVDLTTAEISTGCNDENTCTADSCEDNGLCVNGELDGTPCNDDNVCTTGDTCETGDCVGTSVPNGCTADAQCPDSTCVGEAAGTCTLPPATPCFSNADCTPIVGVCLNAVIGVCGCDDGEVCTEPDSCVDGVCVGDTTPAEPPACSDDNDCTDDECVDGTCQSTVDNTNECSDSVGCTTGDICVAGVCSGTPNDAACVEENVCVECICSVTNDCECSNITGPSDEECSLVLTTLALSADLLTDLTALALPACEVGLTACLDGVEESCELSGAFADTCTAATLDAACGTTVFGLEANAETAAQLCAELQVLAEL